MVFLILFFLLLFMGMSFLLLKAVLTGQDNLSSLELSVLISFTAIMVTIALYLGGGNFFASIIENSEGQLGKDLNNSVIEFIHKK